MASKKEYYAILGVQSTDINEQLFDKLFEHYQNTLPCKGFDKRRVISKEVLKNFIEKFGENRDNLLTALSIDKNSLTEEISKEDQETLYRGIANVTRKSLKYAIWKSDIVSEELLDEMLDKNNENYDLEIAKYFEDCVQGLYKIYPQIDSYLQLSNPVTRQKYDDCKTEYYLEDICELEDKNYHQIKIVDRKKFKMFMSNAKNNLKIGLERLTQIKTKKYNKQNQQKVSLDRTLDTYDSIGIFHYEEIKQLRFIKKSYKDLDKYITKMKKGRFIGNPIQAEGIYEELNRYTKTISKDIKMISLKTKNDCFYPDEEKTFYENEMAYIKTNIKKLDRTPYKKR